MDATNRDVLISPSSNNEPPSNRTANLPALPCPVLPRPAPRVLLQDELDAYDRHQKELEEKLDEKTAALIHLQRVTMEHNANSPVKVKPF
jgi:hypothetical protein